MTTSSGILAGANPLEYNSSTPYTLFIFQLILIIGVAELLHYPLSKIKQPKVISDVLSGIILGPTALGKIPGFTDGVFPDQSMQGLTLVSTLGICLLLFMVGCEVDIKFIKKHFATALSVGIFNMAVPFGLGCAYSITLWKHYRLNQPNLPDIKFSTFMVFIGVSMCITAFPVLVRILTELRLVKDRVGVVVLAAGITNDLLGWILLALSITLANSSKSETTVYIVLVTIAWGLFICYPVRWLLNWVLNSVLHDLDNPSGPSTMAMLIILLMMFASAFFTDIIGVHPIFGAFIMGTIVPRTNNYVIRLTERIEDLVNIILSPLYFGIAGLNADLTLLNKGLDWAYMIGLLAIALFGKILGGASAARLHGLYWRESLTVGVLMSCKGIVEIVVLQTGLRAEIVSKKIFAMFILMALISTFLTTPLTLWCYPQAYREEVRQKLRDEKFKEIENGKKDGNEASSSSSSVSSSTSSKLHHLKKEYENLRFDKLILPVDSLESVSNNLILMDRFCKPGKIPIHAVNIKHLTERTADMLHASMVRDMDDQFDQFDGQYLNGILSILKIFCDLSGVPFSSEIVFSLPESTLQSLLLNENLLPNDLLILTVGRKFYNSQPKFLDQFNKIVSKTDYFSALFINNNQDIGRMADVDDGKKSMSSVGRKEFLEEESLLSNETILNPKSFKISSVSLICTSSNISKDELTALKLFSILVRHEDVDCGYIVTAGGSMTDIASLLKDDLRLAEKIHSTVYEDDKKEKEEGKSKVKTENPENESQNGYRKFVLDLARSRSGKDIDDLVIITKNCPFVTTLIKELEDSNRKILVVF